MNHQFVVYELSGGSQNGITIEVIAAGLYFHGEYPQEVYAYSIEDTQEFRRKYLFPHLVEGQ